VSCAQAVFSLRHSKQATTWFGAVDARLDLGIEFDIYWPSPTEMQRQVTDAGFRVVFWAGRPAAADEQQPQGYLIAQRI